MRCECEISGDSEDIGGNWNHNDRMRIRIRLRLVRRLGSKKVSAMLSSGSGHIQARFGQSCTVFGRHQARRKVLSLGSVNNDHHVAAGCRLPAAAVSKGAKKKNVGRR
jgi:hypothetical protein